MYLLHSLLVPFKFLYSKILKGIKNLEPNKIRDLNGKRTDGIQVMRKLVKVIQGKDVVGKNVA